MKYSKEKITNIRRIPVQREWIIVIYRIPELMKQTIKNKKADNASGASGVFKFGSIKFSAMDKLSTHTIYRIIEDNIIRQEWFNKCFIIININWMYLQLYLGCLLSDLGTEHTGKEILC